MRFFETHVFHHSHHHLEFVKHLQKQLHAALREFRKKQIAVSDREV